MKVLLVNTNRMQPPIAPIGLDYLADALREATHTPRLLDLCTSEDPAADITRSMTDFEPEVIGVTIRNTDDCYFSSQADFLPAVRSHIEALRRSSAAPIVMGGAGYSVAPFATLEECGGDFGIAGEGECALVKLLEVLRDGGDFAQVPGLIYRNGSAWRCNPPEPVDLSRLPVRRRALADNAFYFRKGGQAGFETKRGCPMSCIYCGDPVAKGRTVRLLPPAAVVAELSVLLAEGIDHFHTCDCEFNLPRAHAIEVCRALIDSGLSEQIRWYAYCAPTPFDDEVAGLFKRAGCAGIDFGADSGCDDMLRRLGRHFTTEDLARTAVLCRKHGIPFMYDLLLGAPGETSASIRQTIDFIKRINPDCVGLSLGVRIYPGTPLAGTVQAAGPLEANPCLHGARLKNESLLKPVFYIPPALGAGITRLVRELVAGDPRFFLPDDSPENSNYNYNENTVLVDAIARGARGAYWDILRRMRSAS